VTHAGAVQGANADSFRIGELSSGSGESLKLIIAAALGSDKEAIKQFEAEYAESARPFEDRPPISTAVQKIFGTHTTDKTDSTGFSTNTDMPLDLHGRGYRHPQVRCGNIIDRWSV
jgi:hypothetical protein